MPGRRRYPVPWEVLWKLVPHVGRGTRSRVDETAAIVTAHLDPEPRVLGLERLPASPRFLLVANHYQREGLWILHPAALLTDVLRRHYQLGNPPVRWVVTANWPPWNIGPLRLPSPGNWLLSRVAHAWHCYPVPFAGTDPHATARSLRRLLRDARTTDHPIGLFPEGVHGTADQPAPPLPGTDRLIRRLAQTGMPVQPAVIREEDGLVVEFRETIPAREIELAAEPAYAHSSWIGP